MAKLKAHTFTVIATQTHRFTPWEVLQVKVLSAKPADALALIREEILDKMHAGELDQRPTELHCDGIRGGQNHRFIGWESITWGLMQRQNTNQLELTLEASHVG